MVVDSYERVERVKPDRADLETMIGDHASDDAEATLKVVLEQKDVGIPLGSGANIPLPPAYCDGFISSGQRSFHPRCQRPSDRNG